ncbi:MAG: cbb3-type cytochrome oxidase assembly protein CcoS [Arenicellales bacterium]
MLSVADVVAGLLWAVKSWQFDDMEGALQQILWIYYG